MGGSENDRYCRASRGGVQARLCRPYVRTGVAKALCAPTAGQRLRAAYHPPARLLIWLLILILILIFATSGGRAKGMRREVTGMDARQALRPQGWGLQRVLPGACP
ncbi:hypothetical protein DMX12_23305 [Pseudomonas sp. MB-090624]|nr:hypothetical protein DMX12_23305 [Pseudomonas sp. MB-090624]